MTFQLFKRLREKDPNFLNRITVITGDLEQLQAGISDLDVKLLCDEIEIVIHAAADVRFNEPLYDLILCNLVGTRDLLNLSKQMTKLQVFIYLSTAFSNTQHQSDEYIAEKFYEPPMNADILIDYVQNCPSEIDRELLKIISPNLIRPWPNNYTFSKALSESIVRRYGNDFPIAVIRPTISTVRSHFTEMSI